MESRELWGIGMGAFVGAVWEWMLLETFGVLLVLCLLKFVGAA
jgi:hypothetical protein